ncbi:MULTISPECIES: PAAR domain-containing protein [unclassified Haematospirillum]|uniref:PAAR domain-containing protein n=1 Tax=unclassified Haematospirillum TaxID=2622088 RepID=UPI00143C42A5|nr:MULTISPECIES: PAAR domain-containing protein [unclassified Haematospirillum]NKD56084.1 PaaR repeat-containing protein [Haematospirillum sp. H4890]NKD76133.1 PaaR repeat-containing protein [Haematospirillum sp. H4485]NKD88832.1 PaaR repeat-containing protein [Haematospirillum sp. 15-248]
MPAVTRKNDPCTGHDLFPPRNSTEGSSSVFVNSRPIHRKGDAWADHCDPSPSCHTSTLAEGSASVFANGQAVGRIGDPVSCGSTVAEGSPSVFAG